MPASMKDMAKSICGQFLHMAKRLPDLGLGYLAWTGRATRSPPANASGYSWPGVKRALLGNI